MKKHTAVIEVKNDELNKYTDMLAYGEQELMDNGLPRLANVKTWTATFDNDVQADVKVNTSDNDVWTEAVLFDDKGNELCCTAVCDTIEGEWKFEVDGEEYEVTVKGVD